LIVSLRVRLRVLPETTAAVETTVPFLSTTILERFVRLAVPDWYKDTDWNLISLVSELASVLATVNLANSTASVDAL